MWVTNRHHQTSCVKSIVDSLAWPPLQLHHKKARLEMFYKFHHTHSYNIPPAGHSTDRCNSSPGPLPNGTVCPWKYWQPSPFCPSITMTDNSLPPSPSLPLSFLSLLPPPPPPPYYATHHFTTFPKYLLQPPQISIIMTTLMLVINRRRRRYSLFCIKSSKSTVAYYKNDDVSTSRKNRSSSHCQSRKWVTSVSRSRSTRVIKYVLLNDCIIIML